MTVTVNSNISGTGTLILPSSTLYRNVGASSYAIGQAKNLPREAAPVAVVNTSALASSQEIDGVVAGQSTPNTTKFAFYGAGSTLFAPRSTAVTQNKVCMAPRASADTLGATRFLTSFYLTTFGNTFDLIQYAAGSADVCVFVDGNFLGRWAGPVTTGTAQAGGAASITLAAGASATTGFYNQCYARITGGTGTLNETRQVTAYNGGTKVATVSANWTTPPDATTTYSIDESNVGGALPTSPTLQYINITFPTQVPAQPVTRLIQVISSQFMGVNIGQNDSVTPGPPMFAGAPMIFIGDSFVDGTRSPDCGLPPHYEIGRTLGMQPMNLSSGSTGWWVRGTNQRLNFLNRVAPPAEAWEIGNPSLQSATAGTWTISVTYGGSTQTTSALAFNAAAAAIETALNALSNTPAGGSPYVGPTTQGCWCVARGDINTPFIMIANNMPGATITLDSSALTGGVAGPATQYRGDLYKNIPRDINGVALPFYLYMQGSGNDTSATGYTDAKLQANATLIAQAITANFPTCIPIFGGVITVSDGTGGNGIITAGDLAHNTALAAAAAYLPTINGKVPFVDTYAEGVGGEAYFTGTGTVGAPTNAKRDIFKSLLATGHPTGQGKSYWCARDARIMHQLLQGAV